MNDFTTPLLLLVLLLILMLASLTMEQQHRTVPNQDLSEPIPATPVLPTATIPKKLFQTHKKWDRLPLGMQLALQRMKRMHPSLDYSFYDNRKCARFLAIHFPQRVVQAYKTLIPGAYKADLFRYCLLYHYGGIYIDAGMHCLQPLEGMVYAEEGSIRQFVTSVDVDQCGSAYNAFIASVPKHPILAMAINLCIHRIERREYGRGPLYPTGPYVLGDAVNVYLGRNPGTKLQPGVQGHRDEVLLVVRGAAVKFRETHFGHKMLDAFSVLLYRGQEYADSKYPGFYVDWRNHRKKTYYRGLWQNREIYRNV